MIFQLIRIFRIYFYNSVVFSLVDFWWFSSKCWISGLSFELDFLRILIIVILFEYFVVFFDNCYFIRAFCRGGQVDFWLSSFISSMFSLFD